MTVVAGLEELLKGTAAAVEAGREALAAARLKAGSFEGAALRVKALKSMRDARVKAEKLAVDFKRAADDAAACAHAAAKAEDSCAVEETSLSRVEAAWTRGQAVVLAAGLVAGAPCPVCGAKEHPAPAASGEAAPADIELSSARDAARRGREAAQAARAACTKAEVLRDALAGALSEAKSGLADGEAPPDLPAALLLAEKAFKDAESAASSIKDLGVADASNAKRFESLESGHKTAEKSLGVLRDAWWTAEGTLKERQMELPAEPAALRKDLAAAKALEESLRGALEAGRNVDSEAQKAQERARRALEAARDAAARLDAPSLRRLEAEAEQWTKAQHEAAQRLERARAAASGKPAPDLAALEAAGKEAETAARAAQERLGAITRDVAQRRETLARVRALEAESAASEAELAVVGRVAEVAAGKTGRGISLNRFVLGARLDEVLAQASLRLTAMSRQRYRLVRPDERERQAGAGGLELSVADAHTGRERPVKTLSGEEGFLAALSLALGLSDVVQAASGGMRLESLVIDEGFGTLDEDSLDAAIGALEELQRGGRLIGVISHVGELRGRIPVRLEVTREGTRSTARFVV